MTRSPRIAKGICRADTSKMISERMKELQPRYCSMGGEVWDVKPYLCSFGCSHESRTHHKFTSFDGEGRGCMQLHFSHRERLPNGQLGKIPAACPGWDAVIVPPGNFALPCTLKEFVHWLDTWAVPFVFGMIRLRDIYLKETYGTIFGIRDQEDFVSLLKDILYPAGVNGRIDACVLRSWATIKDDELSDTQQRNYENRWMECVLRYGCLIDVVPANVSHAGFLRDCVALGMKVMTEDGRATAFPNGYQPPPELAKLVVSPEEVKKEESARKAAEFTKKVADGMQTADNALLASNQYQAEAEAQRYQKGRLEQAMQVEQEAAARRAAQYRNNTTQKYQTLIAEAERKSREADEAARRNKEKSDQIRQAVQKLNELLPPDEADVVRPDNLDPGLVREATRTDLKHLEFKPHPKPKAKAAPRAEPTAPVRPPGL